MTKRNLKAVNASRGSIMDGLLDFNLTQVLVLTSWSTIKTAKSVKGEQ